MQWYFSRKEQFAVVVLLLAIIGALFVLSYAYGKRDREIANQPFYTPSTAVGGSDTAALAADVVVHVTGAVNKPGVYTLPTGARVNDAVRLAGGPRADGYADALNLAEKLQDGERLYIPTRAEWQQISAAQGPPEFVTPDATTRPAASARGAATRGRARTRDSETPAPSANTSGATSPAKAATDATPSQPAHRAAKELPAAPININTATLEQLQNLPGVGASTAQKILDYRKTHGKFTDANQLMDVGGIGEKKFAKMAPWVKI